MTTQDPPMTSTKPYLVRAIYEWILDNQMTPHLLVDATYPGSQVPMEFVENGQIILNVAPGAVQGLIMNNEWVQFQARFRGVARRVEVPTEAVLGIFSRENQQGMLFPPTEPPDAETDEGGEARQTKPQAVPSIPGAGKPGPGGPKPGKGKSRPGPTLKVIK